MAELDFARGHRDPTTLPQWICDEYGPDTLGYAAVAYLAGVEVGRAIEREQTTPPATGGETRQEGP